MIVKTDTKTLPLTAPESFSKPLGLFIPGVFGELAVPDYKAELFARAVDDVCLMQADALAEYESISVDNALTRIKSARGTHEESVGFGRLLAQRLPDDFFPPQTDIIGDALILQASGRVIFVLNNQMKAADVVPPKVRDDQHILFRSHPQGATFLIDVQSGLTGVLARRTSEPAVQIAHYDHEAIHNATTCLTALIDKYEDMGHSSLATSIGRLKRIAVTTARQYNTQNLRRTPPGRNGPPMA